MCSTEILFWFSFLLKKIETKKAGLSVSNFVVVVLLTKREASYL